MSDRSPKSPFPRGALIGAALLLGFVLASVAYLRLSGAEPVAQVGAKGEPVASRALRFEDRGNGSVVVYDADEGAAQERVAVLETGEGGFTRGVLRALTRERQQRDIGREEPFRLIRHSNGALVLLDPATGDKIDLRAFGPTNTDAFEKLLPAAGGTQ